MSNNLGQNTAAGFLPAQPGVDDLMKMLTGKTGGWDELNNSPAGKNLQDQVKNPQDDLAECFAKVHATPAGKRVIEAMLDQTLRRSPYLTNDKGGFSLEQQTVYGLERKGQNGLAIWWLSMILAGQNTRKTSKSKKNGG